MRLQAGQTVAFNMSQCLGDSLLAMIVVNNLVRNGYRVVVFGDYIHSLKAWFPSFEVYPTVRPERARAYLEHFDVLLHAYPRNVVDGTLDWHPRCLVMETWPTFRQVKNMVDIHAEVCEKDLGLCEVVRVNGLVAPVPSRHRMFMQRVVIHPTASLSKKMWLRERFLSLACKLRERGFEPEVIVAPHEREDWLPFQKEQGIAVPELASLSDVAERIYESGWFVGNDSGLAHLASNVGVPAVSLMVRNKIARRWRPGWAPSRAVLPLPVLPGKFAKDRLWQHFLPVSRVLRAFDELQETQPLIRPLVESLIRPRIQPHIPSVPPPLSQPSDDGGSGPITSQQPTHSSPGA
jgi:heptosyltransferase-3